MNDVFEEEGYYVLTGNSMVKLSASSATENVVYTDGTCTIPWAQPDPNLVYGPGHIITPWFNWSTGETGPMKKEGEPKVRYLFHVYVVDPKSGKVEFDAKIVAENREQAILKAGLPLNVLSSIEDYDILTQQIGQVRAKKEVQKVKVVTEGE